MALPTMNIPDFSGITHTVNLANSGRQAAADSSAVVLSNEDLAALTGSRPVTGTFWQATQPVSGTVAATQSGTYNITNISGTVSLPTGAATSANQTTLNTNIGATTDAAVANGAAGTIAGYLRSIKDAATDTTTASPISAAALPLPSGASTSANQTTLNSVAGATTDAATANGAAGTLAGYLRSIKDAATDTTTPSPVTAPTLTKGTQGANGWSVQQLKDAGRSALCMTAEFAFAQTAETLLTLTLSADGAATTTFSSRVITSGKKFRVQSVSATVESLGSGTAPQRAYLRLRRNTAGATTATSALQAVWGFVNATAIVKSGFSMDYEVPDGLEMAGDGTGTFGFTLETPDWVTSTATGRIKLTVIGVEF